MLNLHQPVEGTRTMLVMVFIDLSGASGACRALCDSPGRSLSKSPWGMALSSQALRRRQRRRRVHCVLLRGADARW
jgi:hypothetical protein